MSEHSDGLDIQIADTEGFRSDKESNYSHQQLVMKAKMRVLDLGGHEFVDGTYQRIEDPVRGTVKLIYREDTKRAFVNAVQMCMAIMGCDFDEDAEKAIGDLEAEIEDKKEEYLKEQKKFWDTVSPLDRQKSGINFHPEFFEKKWSWYAEFVTFEIETYIRIFVELNNLAKRLEFYSAEQFEA